MCLCLIFSFRAERRDKCQDKIPSSLCFRKLMKWPVRLSHSLLIQHAFVYWWYIPAGKQWRVLRLSPTGCFSSVKPQEHRGSPASESEREKSHSCSLRDTLLKLILLFVNFDFLIVRRTTRPGAVCVTTTTVFFLLISCFYTIWEDILV